MNSIKRIFISIKSQIDRVADDFENHEALAEAAIEDLQNLAGKTRLHLHRLEKMTEQYHLQLSEQHKQAELWTQRAIKIRAEDEQKALQCVRRLKQAQSQISCLEKQIEDSKTQEVKVRQDLNAIQERLLSLKNKKEIYSARQNSALLRDSLNNETSNPVHNAESIFNRWEGAIVSDEFTIPETYNTDSFANEFEKEEDDFALRSLLDELTQANSDMNQQESGDDHVQ